MSEPTWLSYGLAWLMVAVSLYCIARLIAARRWGRPSHFDVNVAHGVMGVAMAGMLAPRLALLPNAVSEVVFIAMAVWFSGRAVAAWRAGGGGSVVRHYFVHVVMALAMTYMAVDGVRRVGASGAASMTAATGTRADLAGVPLLFVAALLVSALWQLDGLSVSGSSVSGTTGRARLGVVALATAGSGEGAGTMWLAPRLEVCCHIVMCVTMAYVLVLLL